MWLFEEVLILVFIVFDFVMVFISGDVLLDVDVIEMMIEYLFLMVVFIMFNLFEVCKLIGSFVIDFYEMVEMLFSMGFGVVFLKGGYGLGDCILDVLVMLEDIYVFEDVKIEIVYIYGMGCIFVMVIVVYLVDGMDLKDIVGWVCVYF